MVKDTRKAPKKEGALTFRMLMTRETWRPIPSISVFAGNADFLKEEALKRLTREVFGANPQEVRRFQGPPNDREIGALPLPTVLDELQTPSFFSPARLVILERGNTFLGAHGDDLVPFLEKGFSGGHLAVLVDGKLDGRTRFARRAAENGWVVECAQPYDRPPPWDSKTPAWDSELSHWIVAHARTKDLSIDAPTAFLLHERAGTDLAVIDEELEKIVTFLGVKGSRRVDAEAIAAVTADLRESSVFAALDLFLEGRRGEALDAVQRVFRKGYHGEKGALTIDPSSIALLFIGSLVPRLRSLRRAHAMVSAGGAGPDDWIAAGIVQRPFLARFQRQLRAVPPQKIARLLERLYETDKSIKTGGDPERLLEVLLLELGTAPKS
ncbi:MAG TPA: DNA polymerase III subunit delta [Planctomycetota bacterium]|nr:DNA polymerase III subunit delta [Planctomycetota bacterium]